MKTVGIVAKRGDAAALKAARDVYAWLVEQGHEVLLEKGGKGDEPGLPYVEGAELSRRCDVLVVLGGDGTLIHTAGLVGERPIPIFGVNLGSLGFLTEIEVGETYSVLERVLLGEAELDERMRLQVRLHRAEKLLVSRHVVNDVVITKGALSRIIDFEATVDGTHLTTYKADGIIVATPTGSTAYNLAAGGPVLHPALSAIIVTPICPHTLTHRPIVVPDRGVCRVRILGPSTRVFLTLDGQEGHELQAGDVVEVSRSPYPLQIVRSPARSFFEVLRVKLKWGSR